MWNFVVVCGYFKFGALIQASHNIQTSPSLFSCPMSHASIICKGYPPVWQITRFLSWVAITWPQPTRFMWSSVTPEEQQKNEKMSGASQVPVGADPKIKEIMTSLDDDKIGKRKGGSVILCVYRSFLFYLKCKMFVIPDMLAATSVLQHQATEVRAKKVNWQSYFQ